MSESARTRGCVTESLRWAEGRVAELEAEVATLLVLLERCESYVQARSGNCALTKRIDQALARNGISGR